MQGHAVCHRARREDVVRHRHRLLNRHRRRRQRRAQLRTQNCLDDLRAEGLQCRQRINGEGDEGVNIAPADGDNLPRIMGDPAADMPDDFGVGRDGGVAGRETPVSHSLEIIKVALCDKNGGTQALPRLQSRRQCLRDKKTQNVCYAAAETKPRRPPEVNLVFARVRGNCHKRNGELPQLRFACLRVFNRFVKVQREGSGAGGEEIRVADDDIRVFGVGGGYQPHSVLSGVLQFGAQVAPGECDLVWRARVCGDGGDDSRAQEKTIGVCAAVVLATVVFID